MAIYDIINSTIDIQDSTASSQSLEKILIFDPDLNENSSETIINLTQEFVSLSDLGDTFTNVNKIHKAGNAWFSQPGHQRSVKVGRTASGDANITASLDNILDEDNGFFILVTVSRDETEIDTIADWASSKQVIFIASTEFDSNKLDSADETDLAKTLAALSYNNVGLHCHHRAGIDAATVGLVVSSGVATVTSTAHGLRTDDIGKEITVSGHSDTTNVNGNRTIATIPNANSFTFLVPDADDATSEDVDYFTRYDFIEVATLSSFFSSLVGSDSYAYQENLVGQIPVPKTVLTDSQIEVLRAKNYITYREPYTNSKINLDGKMVTGRQIKDQVVAVWLDVNIEAMVYNIVTKKKPSFTNEGGQQIVAGIEKPLDDQLGRGGLNSLISLNPTLYSTTYKIDVPDASTATSANRQAGIFPAITVTAAVGAVILKVTVNATLLV
jgi:hypothetical protein